MKTILKIMDVGGSACGSLLVTAALLSIPALAGAQPAIELAPDEPKKVIPRPAGLDLPRESQIDVPLSGVTGSAATGIGAYGEVVLEAPVKPPTDVGADPDHPRIDVRRLVLFLGHNFTDKLRVYTELELEHAITSADDQGEFEVEQLFLDYLPIKWLNVRAGLILMPVGIVNVFHEPPTFNGANRPETDTRIIPSTWREVGGGVFGGVGPLRWQLYGVTGFKAGGWDAEGLREGHQEGQLARAHDWGAVARVDYSPVPAVDIGASGYYAGAGQGDEALVGVNPGAGLAEIDARFRWRGLEARGELVNVWITDADRLNVARLAAYQAQVPAPSEPFQAVARQLRGGYVELGYNLLQPAHLALGSSLVLFGRYERTDTQAEVSLQRDAPGAPAFATAPGKDRQVITAGLNFRPVAEIAVKVDYQHLTAVGHGMPERTWSQINAGLGFMF